MIRTEQASKPPDNNWWKKPRKVAVLVDNPSWILPWAERLVASAKEGGDLPRLARSWVEVDEGEICFMLGCTQLVPEEILKKNLKNLVVHESGLPEGRGFAPLSWQILEGRKDVPVCLIEAIASADAGPVIFKDNLHFEGHELCGEIRAMQGEITLNLCCQYLDSKTVPKAVEQVGKSTLYPRRTQEDSRLDTNKTIREQMNLLRIVDNGRYPAFFDYKGHRYELLIKKAQQTSPSVYDDGC
jgi:methionyl-tRNA formyltransferase